MFEALRKSPVIAAVRGSDALSRAICSPVRVIFLLGGDLFSLPEWVGMAKDAGKLAFVHMDFVDGISRDAAGVRAVARMARPSGVLTTRAPLLRVAAEEGLYAVLRMFIVDSSSIETGTRMVKTSAPDLVEIMPGLMTRAIVRLSQRITPPIIAGGMITDVEDIRAALASGALGVSTSSDTLWSGEA